MAQTDGTGDSVDIGVSLSGGGHRATLFGLGVLLYLAHAHDERDVPLSRRVSAISSVSGGSITNGFLARSLDYRSAEADQVEAAAQILTMQLAEHGTLFARRRVKAYAVSLVGLATLGLLGLAAGLTLRTGGWIVIALASILVLLLAALAAQARGRVCEWALADALFSDRTGHRYPLSIMTRSTRHIICATEIQTGQAMWFTAKGAVSRAFTLSDEPGDLSLARAVQASACLPVAFPPRRLRAQPTRLLEANWPRGARLPTRAVVVDGGVRDNLGVDVFLAWGEEVPAGAIENVGDVIVVSGSATRVKRSRLGRDIPLLGEMFSLRKLSNLPYSTREANTRRALEWRFRAAPDLEPQGWPRLRGTLVHIEESPAELADEIQLWVRDWEWQSTPPSERSDRNHPYRRKRQVEFLSGLDPPPARWVTNFLGWSERLDASGRAEAVLEVLARAEPDTKNVVTTWRERAVQNAAMRTTLSRVPPELAAQLIEHGYALAMARLHILQGYPLIDMPPRHFFRRLAGLEAAT